MGEKLKLNQKWGHQKPDPTKTLGEVESRACKGKKQGKRRRTTGGKGMI